jgi:hypothetical protein
VLTGRPAAHRRRPAGYWLTRVDQLSFGAAYR